MLDSTIILQDVEELLNEHFGQLQMKWPQQDEQPAALVAAPITQSTSLPPANSTVNPVADFVANVMLVLIFSALEKRLSA